MTDSNEQIIKSIRHYQSNLDKYTASKNEQKVLHYIERLRKLPIKVSHLEETGVGRTVNSLRKLDGNIGEAARKLVSKWKNMVVQEQKEEEDNKTDDDEDDDEDEDEEDDRIEIQSSSKEKTRHSTKNKPEKRKHSDEEEILKEKKHKKHKKHHKSYDREKSSSSSKDKTHHKTSSSSSSKKKTDKDDKNKHGKHEKRVKNVSQSKDGIDSASGTTFDEALGFCAPLMNTKSTKKKVNEEKPSSSREKQQILAPPAPSTQIDMNLSTLLPTLTPNYRPLGNILSVENAYKRPISEDETLSRVISSKNQRTKVYSGNKVIWGKVPTLFEICIRFLQDNIEYLEYTGGVPYAILKPVLEKANPDQLYLMEHHNPYLIEETDELWQLHCQREFRTKQREEMESWRDMYMRCLDEREAKLKTLTANIKQAQDKSLPVRTTKLAYVDDVVKPPRNIARKQMKNGIVLDNKRPQMTPASRLTQLATAGEAGKIAVPNPGSRASEQRTNTTSSSTILKPKKAPLMAKTLTLFKNRFRR